MYKYLLYQWDLGSQGSSECHSVHRGLASQHASQITWPGVCIQEGLHRGGVGIRGSLHPGGWADPPYRQTCSRGGAIPACIAGGIPACLAAGLWGVLGCYPSMHCRWYPSIPCSRFRGVPAPGEWGVYSGGSAPRGWFCSGGLLPGGAWWRPPGRLLLRAVRILLECILVLMDIITQSHVLPVRMFWLCAKPIFITDIPKPFKNQNVGWICLIHSRFS